MKQQLTQWKHKMLSTPKRKQVAVSGSIILCAALMSASIFATGPSADPAAHVEKAWPVSTTVVTMQTLRPNFAAFGRVESNRIARLRSKLNAPVAQVMVSEGDWVEAGEVLVLLDAAEFRLMVAQREADLLEQQAMLRTMQVDLELEQQSATHFEAKQAVAQAKLQRHQDLMGKRLISKALLDEVTSQANEASIQYRRHISVLRNLPNQITARKAGVARAQAQLAQAQLDLDNAVIRAPFTGPVLAVYAAPGDHNNSSQPLVEMADAGGIEVRVQVPDSHAQTFREAQSQGAQISARTEDGTPMELSRLTNHVKSGQTGLDAFFRFSSSEDEDAQQHTLGRVFNVRVEMPAQDNLIAVPVQSIYENNRVYTVVEGRLVAHEVERIGEYESVGEGYKILIADPELAQGDAIVTTQLPKAVSGLLVEVAQDADT